MRICVYGAASPFIDKEYIEKVEALGRRLPSKDTPLSLAAAVTVLWAQLPEELRKRAVIFWA